MNFPNILNAVEKLKAYPKRKYLGGNYVVIAVFFFIFFFLTTHCTAQSLQVTNVRYKTIDNTIEIIYDLPVNNDSVEVKLFFQKHSDSTFLYHPKFVSGSVGKGKFSGRDRRIIWYFRKEIPGLFTGSGFYFRIRAVKIGPKAAGE
jgi:hypothetical protein